LENPSYAYELVTYPEIRGVLICSKLLLSYSSTVFFLPLYLLRFSFMPHVFASSKNERCTW